MEQKNNFAKCVVKISVSSTLNYHLVDRVIYYKSGLSPDFIEKWMWYFEYLAALVKVKNPRIKVFFYYGPQDCMIGDEWHQYRRNVLLKNKQRKLKKLEIDVIDDDLFHFKSQDNEQKKNEILLEIEQLENDTFPIEKFPKSKNIIKELIK